MKKIRISIIVLTLLTLSMLSYISTEVRGQTQDPVSGMWTTTEVVSTESTDNSWAPTMAVDGAGNVHLAWYDWTDYDNSGPELDIFYKRWDAVSGMWTTTEVVSTESTRLSYYPTMAVDGVGNVHVAWNDGTDYDNSGTDYDIFYKRWDAVSGTWTTTEVVSTESTGLSWYPTMAVDGAGNVHVAWRDYTDYDNSGTDYHIFYKRWDAVSGTWTTTEVVSTESTNSSYAPTIAVDGAGNVHVAWFDNTDYDNSETDYDIFYKRWDAVSGTWTTTEVVSTESTGLSWYPTMAVDGAGNVHVAWGESTYDDIFYKRWDAVSGTWTTTEVVSTESTSSYYPTMAVDSAGNVHVAWYDDTDYDNSGPDVDIFYKRLSVPEIPEIHLKYGTDSGPVNLDPHYAREISSFDVIEQVVEPLYAYDLLDPELAPIPRLASDFGTWSIDGLNYTVPLRMGVTFHDGTLFNATAVKWNFDRLAYFMNLENPTRISHLYLWFDGVMPIINKVEIVDEYTVKFVLNKPFAPFEALLCFSGSGIMSPASTPPENYIDTATGDLVGTGPFVYDNYEVDVEVTMHAYENYWGGAPYIDELTFSIITDINGRNLALLDGSIDFIKTPQNSFLQLFRDDPDITLVDAGQDATIRFLGMNNKLINVLFREAISYAINYTYMIDELLGGEAVRLKSPIPLGTTYANWEFNVPILNLPRARQVMQSMGFGVGFDLYSDAEWTTQATSSPFRSINYTYNIGNTFREDMLVLLQDNLGKIGIKVVDAGMTWSEYWYRLADISPHSRNELELFWLGWYPDYNDPSNIINSLFSKNSVSNFAQVDDDLVQVWMEEALITINPAERKVLYDNIQQRLIEEVFPWAWGYVRRNYDAHSSKFTGFQSNPMDKVWFYPVSRQVPEVNDYIQDIPDEAFINNAEQRKNALSEMLNEVIEYINNGEYEEAIEKLQMIRKKCDGSLGGKSGNDWIIDPEIQQELCAMIDALIAFLETLI